MKIAFKNRRIIINSLLGAAWLIIGLSYFLNGEGLKWKTFAVLTLGIVYVVLATSEYYYKYITITDQQIRINQFPGKKINIDEIISAGYYADDYTLKTAHKTMKILRSQINPKDLPKFELFFNNLTSKLKAAEPLLSYERK
ncbi:EbsA family protein [Chryseobacterium sp. PMSZPI]|uniref:EbsA family protein n=1 Tax=Chryseobacterium sp. PMSZPI TaxID=1033900 RepID=UPI000C332B26|nr:EbsA family protein [Chryseobacterium sp. PMSZPI]PKF74256.1 hypothetical protein CW752_10035 [Chryseobacterium sp. PMSZPI]